MARKEDVERLTERIYEWKVWRKASRVIPDLSGADLRGLDLNGENLSEADLSEANLSGANLSGADLRRAILRQASVDGADLQGANLSGADSSEASFISADLRDADLSQVEFNAANIMHAELNGARLAGANWSNLRLGWTVLADVDLSAVRGLDKARHAAPSTIGIDTIHKSGGKIPDAFLRGVGVPESFIAYIGAVIGKPVEFYSCFISYSHSDKAFARRLHDTLQGRGIRCWLDEHQLLPGDDIYEHVDRGIRLWDKVLLCCSKASLSSWWVDSEIGKAFAKEQTLTKDRGNKTLALIPLNLDGELFAWQDGKADEIRRRLAADFTDWDRNNARFESEIERVIRALRTNDGGREPPPKSFI